MYVVVNAGWAVALYCQRCGKLHIHDVSYFTPMERTAVLRCSCGHPQATLTRIASKRFRLELPCVVCDSMYQEEFSSKVLMRIKAEKIYCVKDHFELGYIGNRSGIEEILAFNQQLFASLDGGGDVEQIERQQILLDALNCLHDIAEQKGIHCSCGSAAISADIVGDYVILECCHCGSYYILPAGTEADLAHLREMKRIDLLQERFLIKNIDLD